jgi:hypothetical protein
MSENYLSCEDIRSIIHNAHKIKEFNKCPNCNGTGWENWNGETGDDIKPGRLADYDSIRLDGECEKCEGVGYTDYLMYED